MSRKRFTVISLLTAVLVVMMNGCQMASVEPETDNSQNEELTEGVPTAEISEVIPVKYVSQRFSECGTIEKISYAMYDYFGDGSEIEKYANVYLPYGYDEEKNYNG